MKFDNIVKQILNEDYLDDVEKNIIINGKKVDSASIEVMGSGIDTFPAYAEFENGEELSDEQLDELSDKYRELFDVEGANRSRFGEYDSARHKKLEGFGDDSDDNNISDKPEKSTRFTSAGYIGGRR
jgi:hypothetical protein